LSRDELDAVPLRVGEPEDAIFQLAGDVAAFDV
jgi:hypothetical protein